MSPLLFVLETDVDTIWLNCTEEQIEQVHILLSVGLHDLAELATWPGRDKKQSVLCTVCSVLNHADGFYSII